MDSEAKNNYFNPRKLCFDADIPYNYMEIRKKVNEICEWSYSAYNSYKKIQFLSADFFQFNKHISRAIHILVLVQ